MKWKIPRPSLERSHGQSAATGRGFGFRASGEYRRWVGVSGFLREELLVCAETARCEAAPCSSSLITALLKNKARHAPPVQLRNTENIHSHTQMLWTQRWISGLYISSSKYGCLKMSTTSSDGHNMRKCLVVTGQNQSQNQSVARNEKSYIIFTCWPECVEPWHVLTSYNINPVLALQRVISGVHNYKAGTDFAS